MRNTGKTLLIILLILAIAACGIGAGMGVTYYRNSRVYTQKIESGDKYLAAGDYDNAVLMYQQAIRLNDKDETGYLKLANAYNERGDIMMAIGTLETGYAKTQSSRIQDMLLLYQSLGGSASTPVKDPLLNISLLNKINESSYGDYVNRNEVADVRMNGTAEAIVRINGISADFIFRNTRELPNVIVNKTIANNAFPSEVRFDDLIGLFGVSGPVTMAQLETMEFDTIRMESAGDATQMRMMYLGSTIIVPCDSNGTIETSTAGIVEPSVHINAGGNKEKKTGGVTTQGTVEDAQSGVGIEEVMLTFYEGATLAGDPVAEVVTDSDGNYTIDLDGGQYRVILTKEGYSELDKQIYIGAYTSEHEEDFVLSKDSASEIRIVLEWSGGSCDLDSYLKGGGSLMNFRNTQITSGGETAAVLDRDARSAPGVETTTIYDMNGSYEFFVFDYMLSGTMQSSGATVTIYAPGESPQTVSIPSDAGNTWYVCRIEAGKVRITNYMAEESSSYAPK